MVVVRANQINGCFSEKYLSLPKIFVHSWRWRYLAVLQTRSLTLDGIVIFINYSPFLPPLNTGLGYEKKIGTLRIIVTPSPPIIEIFQFWEEEFNQIHTSSCLKTSVLMAIFLGMMLNLDKCVLSGGDPWFNLIAVATSGHCLECEGC